MSKQHLTFAIMDAPFENARTVTAFRLIDLAIARGHDVTVFAYEGAVNLAFAKQVKHANAVHGRDAEQEDHPLPREWIAAMLARAEQTGSKVDFRVKLDLVRDITRKALSGVSDGDLETVRTWKDSRDGVGHQFSVRWVLNHVLEHEAHHRGQILLLKAALGR